LVLLILSQIINCDTEIQVKEEEIILAHDGDHNDFDGIKFTTTTALGNKNSENSDCGCSKNADTINKEENVQSNQTVKSTIDKKEEIIKDNQNTQVYKIKTKTHKNEVLYKLSQIALSLKLAEKLVPSPSGDFLMGTPENQAPYPADGESPQRPVYLDDYSIDIAEVSVGQFAKFVQDTNYTTDAEKYTWSFVFGPFFKRKKISSSCRCRMVETSLFCKLVST